MDQMDCDVLDRLEARLLETYYGSDGRAPRRLSQLSFPVRRPAFAAGWAGLLALVVGVAIAISGAPAPALAVVALNRAAAAAARAPSDALTGGSVWYTRVISEQTMPLIATGRPGQAQATAPLEIRSRSVSRTWIALSGTIRQRSRASVAFANPAESKRYRGGLASPTATRRTIRGRGALPSPLVPTRPLFSYRRLRSLPTSAAALRRELTVVLRRVLAPGSQKRHVAPGGAAVSTLHLTGSCCGSTAVARGALERLMAVSWLLSMPVTARERAALYHTAATLRGVRYLGAVRDALGRRGVGVAVGHRGDMFTLIFDPGTGALLGTSIAFGSRAGTGFGPLIQTVETRVVRGQ